jgi:Co/Zn/Cd efflux system component
MSAHCQHDHHGPNSHGHHDHSIPPEALANPRYRKVLWVVLVLNAAMFLVEILGSAHTGSVSLLADALDFAGDAANYGLSLAVLGMALVWRARAALVKGLSMGLYGVLVLGKTAWAAQQGIPPEPIAMGLIALLALAVNVASAVLLYAFREGDANMRSVWLCSRNDAIGNVAVVAAAVGVFGTHTAWPDLGVAAVMALLALSAAVSVVRQARGELAHVR